MALCGVTNLPGMSLRSQEKRGQIHTIPCNIIRVYAANSLKPHTHHDANTRTVLEDGRKHDPDINYNLIIKLYQKNHYTWTYTLCQTLTNKVLFLNIQGSLHSLQRAEYHTTHNLLSQTLHVNKYYRNKRNINLTRKYEVLILPKPLL